MKYLLTIIIGLFFMASTWSQSFVPAHITFSGKKISYITMEDGSILEGYIKNVDRKKGLIKSIKVKDENGKKHKLKPEAIKEMYLAPSGYSKFANAYSKFYDATSWDDEVMDSDKIKEGYAYFIKTDVMLKKKKKTLLLQLLNPGFSNAIKVFDDPYAGEKASLGVGAFKVAGGEKKSYFVKKGNDVAYKLKSKKYKKAFKEFYGCKKMNKKFEKKKWSKLIDHIIFYTAECK